VSGRTLDGLKKCELPDAFGFFDTEEEHEAVLREAARVLAAGARLVLKIVNGVPILHDFRETGREERDGTIISVSSALDVGAASNDPEDQHHRKSRSRRVRTTPAPVSG